MKKRRLQLVFLYLIYKGILQWFLKIIIGVQFGDNCFLKKETQFIIIANHNSHLDTLSLMASLPGEILWKTKPVAAKDYFGSTRLKATLSNYFINTLLISRKIGRDADDNPIQEMLETLDAGFSLILFPEGSRGMAGQMEKMKNGIAHILSQRPHVKYIPVYLTGMGQSLPKGEFLMLPYKSSVNWGVPSLVNSVNHKDIMAQIIADFQVLEEKHQPLESNDE